MPYGIEEFVKNTSPVKIFYDHDYPVFDASRLRDQKVSVSADRSFQAAMRLKKEFPESRIAVLNFANAFHPGGGVEAGASAQEECLCRCSTLYPLLNRNYLLNNFYDYHEEQNLYSSVLSLAVSDITGRMFTVVVIS